MPTGSVTKCVVRHLEGTQGLGGAAISGVTTPPLLGNRLFDLPPQARELVSNTGNFAVYRHVAANGDEFLIEQFLNAKADRGAGGGVLFLSAEGNRPTGAGVVGADISQWQYMAVFVDKESPLDPDSTGSNYWTLEVTDGLGVVGATNFIPIGEGGCFIFALGKVPIGNSMPAPGGPMQFSSQKANPTDKQLAVTVVFLGA